MWAVSPVAPTLFLCRSTRQPLRTLSRSVTPKNDGVYDEDIGGLGHTLLSNINPASNSPVSQQHKQKQKQAEADGKQLSGSEVLWALQRAATAKKKKKNKKKRRELSSTDTHRGDEDVHHADVKPLCINAHWAAKLDELDKRFQELSVFSFLL